MNVQNANNELNKREKVKKIFWCIAFVIVALFWFFEMICGLSLWLEGAHHRSLGGTELIRVSIAEKVLDIACFPSICLEFIENDRTPGILYLIGFVVDSLFWSFLIIIMARVLVKFFVSKKLV